MSENSARSLPSSATIVKAHAACDFLALVPQLVGFLPEQSMVLVAFRGNRTCGAMRFNLPAPDESPAVHKRIATTLIGMICKIRGADAVVPVVYTDEKIAAANPLPQTSFVGRVLDRAEASGFLVRDALCVGADAFASFLEPEAGGHPLSEITGSSIHSEMPEHATRPLAVLRSGAELPGVDKPTKERCARLLRRYRRALDGEEAALDLMMLYKGVLDPVEIVEEALGWDAAALDAQNAAALLFLAHGPAQRDQMMLQFAFGRDVGVLLNETNLRYAWLQRTTGLSLDEIVRAEDDARQARRATAPTSAFGNTLDGMPGDLLRDAAGGDGGSDLILGLSSERPDPDRVERAIELLKTAVALAPRAMRPAPLCMLAWLSWALGGGSVAGMFLDEALTIDREYGMALLLNTLIGSGQLPEWAYAVPNS
ncbi:DUF4192 family protein [Leifsonia sp. YAF41]|uniref:DUF4192 family protein n=1 Tax=Leifsonia sp. YAF41 TaxID=3233086 RepID=UPI003F9B5708